MLDSNNRSDHYYLQAHSFYEILQKSRMSVEDTKENTEVSI